jgi:hypothetical protein
MVAITFWWTPVRLVAYVMHVHDARLTARLPQHRIAKAFDPVPVRRPINGNDWRTIRGLEALERE